ncbi:MAG TPA: tRNA dihydrouridine synthase DusB [Marinilabiliaceae bacterium]|nr:tRNA dihydrouridine synthase DusB [Marinilabiliaceae bacterium]
MKIGNIELPKESLMLAPMEDVSNHMFRRMCKQFGADLMYTEFVSSDALVRNIEKTKRKLILFDDERPIGIQLYGKDPEALAEAARIAEEYQPDLIDLNFGCPVKKIATKGAGSGLLRDIPKMIEITRAVVEAVKVPVTVKTRLGWDDNSKDIVDLAEQLQDTGIQALTIHGRTREQLYTGDADWTLIGEVKNNPRMHIPIFGNGDVTTPQRAREYFDRYGVDGVMIGRGAIGKPWIFREIRHYLNSGELLPPPSMKEHVEMILQYFKTNVEHIGERAGILHTRRHFAVTFKNLPHFRETKIALLRSENVEDIHEILKGIEKEYGDY